MRALAALLFAIVMLGAQRAKPQADLAYVHVERIEKGEAPPNLAAQVVKLEDKLATSTDPAEQDKLRQQLSRAKDRAEDAADWIILGIGQYEGAPSVIASGYATAIVVPKRMNALAKKLKAGDFVTVPAFTTTPSNEQWRGATLMRDDKLKIAQASRPSWWHNDDSVERPWDTGIDKLTEDAKLTAEVGTPRLVLPHAGDSADTAFGTMHSGGSLGGNEYPIVVHNGGGPIASARIILRLLDQDGDEIGKESAAITDVKAGGQQTLHIFIPKGATHDDLVSAKIDVSYLRRP